MSLPGLHHYSSAASRTICRDCGLAWHVRPGVECHWLLSVGPPPKCMATMLTLCRFSISFQGRWGWGSARAGVLYGEWWGGAGVGWGSTASPCMVRRHLRVTFEVTTSAEASPPPRVRGPPNGVPPWVTPLFFGCHAYCLPGPWSGLVCAPVGSSGTTGNCGGACPHSQLELRAV